MRLKPLTLARGPLRVPARPVRPAPLRFRCPGGLVRGLLVLCAAAPALPQPAAAQRAAADSAAILLAAAADLQARGELETAQLLHSLILESFPGTAAAESAEARLGGFAKDRSRSGGEIELKVWSALFGLWQGLAIPDAMDAGSPVRGIGLLVGAPAGFLLGHRMGRSRAYSAGQARAVTWGGIWGAVQGMGWAKALDLGADYYWEDESSEAVSASMAVGAALGMVGGMVVARHEIRPGTSTSAMLGSLWGVATGLMTLVLVDPDMEGDELWANAMHTGNIGLVAGTYLGSRMSLSPSRAALISLGGVIGYFAGLGVNLIDDPDGIDTSERRWVGSTLASTVVGLATATYLTREDRGGDDPREDAEAAGTPAAPGALFNRSGGDWALAAPLPSPVWHPSIRRDGRGGLSWKVPLLSLRF